MQRSSLNNATGSPPAVSVIIPAYNAAAYIAATLDSVFRQSVSDYEVIVVNDGSPDTAALEAALAPYLDRIRYFRQENRGPSAARNLGIREARGTFVALLDSDDLWFPEHLARQISALHQEKSIGLVYSNSLHISGAEALGAGFDRVPQIGAVTLDRLLAEDCTVNTSSVVVLREAVLRAGLFDETMNRCEDFDLWLRLAQQGVGMAYNRDVQVVHRLSDGLSSNSALMKKGRSGVYRKALERLPLNTTQRNIVLGKLRDLEVEIEIEAAKQHLAAGHFAEAREAVSRAGRVMPSLRYRVAIAALYFCPRLLRRTYSAYIRALAHYKRRKRVAGGKVVDDRTLGVIVNAARTGVKNGNPEELDVTKPATVGYDRL